MTRFKGRPSCVVAGSREADVSLSGFEVLEPRVMLSGDVVINEFMAVNDSTIADVNGEYSDWIELYNRGDEAVDLTGWYLTDDLDDFGYPELDWEFPSVTLGAGEYLVIFASGEDLRDPAGELHTDFSISGNGEYLGLVMADGETIVSEFRPEFPEQEGDVSYGLAIGTAENVALVADNAAVRVLVPDTASDLASNWNELGYTPNYKWLSGTGGVGYDASGGYSDYFTVDLKSRMYGPYGNGSAFTRQEFTADDVSKVMSLKLNVRYEDGFVAYLNGVEIARDNAPEVLAWDSISSTYRIDTEAIHFVTFDITDHIDLLVDGENVLAVHGMNDSKTNSKFFVHTTLDAVTLGDVTEESYRYMFEATPGAMNSPASMEVVSDVEFSLGHGFFDGPISVELTTPTEDALIFYTLDSTEPSPGNGIMYSGAISIIETSIVRAAAYKTGWEPSGIVSQTYLYVDQVASQDKPDFFPNDWGFDVNFPGGRIPGDYEMDPQVLTDPRYDGDVLETALTALPTMSIIIDIDDFLDEDTGIYANPLLRVSEHGDEWQKLASIEYFDPAGEEEGFTINAGIRMQGGASRNPNSTAKHSMRLTFTSEFGPTKLAYPLFGEDAAVEFDQLTLRAGYGHSWMHSNTFHVNERGQAQYIKDQFARETQLLMGQPSAHGKHVHLYINGVYWGIYNPTERPNAAFAASYLGGDKDDYDALNAGEAIDGDDTAWQQLLTLSDRDLSIESNYRAVEAMLDIDNFIDFNILNIWAGNDDWDTDWTGSLPGHNWYAARHRDGGKFYFFNWDSEHFFCDQGGLYKDLSNGAPNSNMSGMYRSLMANEEYRLRFADRLQKHFFNDGVLTSESVIERYTQLADGMYDAIVAESAKWGDWRRDVKPSGSPLDLYTRDDHWVPRLNKLVEDYFPYRSDIVLNQFKNRGLYPDVDVPSFNQHGGAVSSGFDLVMNSSEGTIYYTMDGSDPREEGGAVSSNAMVYSGSIDLTVSKNVKARVYSGGEWSALNEALFTVDESIVAVQDGLRISELMYHPLGGNDDLEFIEFTNIGDVAIDLTGVSITDGVSYDFANGYVLEPGEYALLLPFDRYVETQKFIDFVMHYPQLDVDANAGFYVGTLSDAGEHIEVQAIDGSQVVSFTYDDTGNWPGRADGAGSSLEMIDLSGDSDKADNWRSSVDYKGSPGLAGSDAIDSVVINEVVAHTEQPSVDQIELHNRTGVAVDVSGWWLSDSSDDYLKYQITQGTVIAAGGYLVLDENDFNPTPDTPGENDFALSGAYGDDVYLTIGDGAGSPRYFVDHIDFGPSDEGVSFGRYPNGDGRVYPMSEPTFGEDNIYPAIGPVMITEIMYHPAGNDDGLEFIELYNMSGSSVDMSEWRLGSAVTYEFEDGFTLGVDETVVVVSFDLDDAAALDHFRVSYGIDQSVTLVGGYDGKLSNDGEKLELLKPGEEVEGDPGYRAYVLVEEVRYNDALPWDVDADGLGESLHRGDGDVYSDDAGSWIGETPSPGTVSFDTRLPGDANEDGQVGLLDLDALGNHWGMQSGAEWSMGDFDNDGKVGLLDLDILGSHWGESRMSGVEAGLWLMDNDEQEDVFAGLAGLDVDDFEIVRLF